MDRRNMLLGGAGALLATLFAAPAMAHVASQTPVVAETGPEIEEVRGRRGGRGRHYGWSRGRHRGWGRGRGRRRGW